MDKGDYSTAADLSVESTPLMNDYYRICENYTGSSSSTINTNCYWIGNTLKCTSN